MKILSIISHKGGSGKTTTAVMLAEELARRGVRTLLADADGHHGARLVLGIPGEPDGVTQCELACLSYFDSRQTSTAQLAAKVAQFAALFDVIVVDTPSLDEGYSRAWLQLSDAALAVIPVEPVSFKTVEALDGFVQDAVSKNDRLRMLGILPTMFEAANPTHAELLEELVQSPGRTVITPSIPYDSALVHRADSSAERRGRPMDLTLAAYQSVGKLVSRELAVGDPSGEDWSPATDWNPSERSWSAQGESLEAAQAASAASAGAAEKSPVKDHPSRKPAGDAAAGLSRLVPKRRQREWRPLQRVDRGREHRRFLSPQVILSLAAVLLLLAFGFDRRSLQSRWEGLRAMFGGAQAQTAGKEKKQPAKAGAKKPAAGKAAAPARGKKKPAKPARG